MTEQGREAFEEFQRTQEEVRETVMDGMGREEYETVIAVLRKIAYNLGSAGI